ncbi:hypothetical protein [Cohnella fermenti]|uniref:Uncharacterized protein n=1 Tax=Cohnella fermenti TaxID=2565925 RepID=A0A4S4C5U8_9BACL|nr:hypothetical protein [Cohnella fermenti]THF82618.1 hypothetical protein E6C55_05955 [Cohnella fermenti]
MRRSRDRLLELEWGRVRHWLSLDARGMALWFGIPLVLVAAGVHLLDASATPRSVFAIGAVFSVLSALLFGAGQAMMLWENPFRIWWLSMPLPREKLLETKAAAGLRLLAAVSLAIWLTCLASSLVRQGLGKLGPEAFAWGTFSLDSLAYLLLYAALLPIFYGIGWSMLGMYTGRRLWLLLPMILAFALLVAVLSAIGEFSLELDRWLQADRVALYALAAALPAKPSYRVLLRFAARHGLRDLAVYRSGSLGNKTQTAAEKREQRVAAPPGFASLYALESSRYRYFLGMKPVRVIASILFLGYAVLSGAMSLRHEDLIGIFQLTLMPTVLVPCIVILTLNQLEANKKRLSWWLCFPYSRSKLLLARMAAVWAVAAKLLAGALLAYALGVAAVRLMLGKTEFRGWDDMTTMIYLLALYLGIGVALGFIMLGQAAAYRSRALNWVFVPLSSLGYFLPMIVTQWIYPEQAYESGLAPVHWLRLALLAVVLVPLAICGFRLGTRWVHLYLLNTQEDLARRRQSRVVGK